MKLTASALILFSLNISATVYSQKTKLSFEVRNQTIKEVLFQIESQSEFRFIYESGKVNLDKVVSVSIKDQPVEDILDYLFKNGDVDFDITENNFILIAPAKNKTIKESAPPTVTQQSKKQVSGKITDEYGESVIGANVVEKGTANGDITNIDGNFTLNVAENAVLVISYIGYHSQEISVTGKTVLNITLIEDTQTLEEVVVVGYGVQKKSNVTGAISSVRSEALQSRSVENVQQALQGKAAGVMVLSSSAAPGSDPKIRIRGISSNNSGSSDPLYIVDGLKVTNISYLDPATIESMEILKDGASAAIYGAEAGNGVVIITTKTGSKGKTRIFYDLMYGITSMGKKPELMNAEQYLAYQTAAGNATVLSDWDGKTDTDWADVLYGDGGSIQRHTLGFEGGNDKGTLYSAASFVHNDGMYYGDKDYLKRLTYQVNATYDIKPWLEFTTNNSIELSKYSMNSDWEKSRKNNVVYLYDPLTPTTFSADNVPMYMQALIKQYNDDMFMKNEAGDYIAVPTHRSDAVNPLTTYYANNSEHKDINMRGATAINFKPFAGFTYTSRLGYRLQSSNYTFYGPPVYTAVSPRLKDRYQAENSMRIFYQWENFMNYAKSFGKHDLTAMAGMSYQNNWYNYTRGTTDEFTNNAANYHYLSYSSAGANDSVAGEDSESTSISYFGRAGYTYDNRYIFQVSFRADAYDSSKLPADNRWGYFPSVTAGWTISNESFMQEINKDVLSYLKIRASYGENGNVNVLRNYPYRSSLSMSEYYPIDGSLISTITPSSVLANPLLQWEEAKQVDVGIDARFLSDRLTLTADYFDKNTTGQLISMSAPRVSGTSSVTRNVGKINNHGFEFEVGWKDNIGDFSYSVNANLATLRNKVKDLGDSPRIGVGNDLDYTFNYFDKGQPIWSYWGWDYLGVAEDGSAIYRDVDDNDIINTYDKVYLGNALPKFTYGITLSAAYKNFDLTIFGSGSQGGKLAMSNLSFPIANAPKVFWTDSYDVKGAGAKYPHPNVNGDTHMYYSDMILFDGSYFKINQIQLGYSIPQNILKKAFMSNLRVFASLDNFFCFTKYPGMDPETINSSDSMGIDVGEYPSPKTMTFGLNLSF